MNIDAEVRKMATVYADGARRIQVLVLGLDPSSFSENEAARVRAAVQAIALSLVRKAHAWAKGAIRRVYSEARTTNVTRLEILGKDKLPRAGKKRHERTIRGIIDTVRDDLARATLTVSRVVSRYLEAVRRASTAAKQLQAFEITDLKYVDRLADTAVKEGFSRYDLKKKLMAYLRRKIATGDFIEVKGRTYSLRTYSELVARTRLRETQTEAVKNACADYDNDLVEIPFKLKSCDICKKIHGKVYSLTGKTPGFPVLNEKTRPPIHCNCEHYLRATSLEALGRRPQ